MICRNCGKEIPDDVKYCGYCGAEQIPEDNSAVDVKEEETVKEEPVKEAETKEEEKDEQPQVIDAETVEKPMEEEQAQVVDAETVEKPVKDEKPVEKKEPKKKLKEADWSSFRVYLSILKKPFEVHEVEPLPLWTGIVVMLIGSWFTFGSFGNGLFVMLFAFAGSIIVQYAGSKGTDDFRFEQAFQQAFCTVFIPFIAILIAGILFHTGYGDITAMTRRLGLIVVLTIFAAVMLGRSIAVHAGNMNSWALALILTAMYAAIGYYMLSQYAARAAALLGMF